tara:strand:- start:661 stop:3855 length:3195 start_codon:yes stop_codon:yes gene_type:complete
MALDWLQQFYKDNNIGGPGGDLDNEAREYWLAEAKRLGNDAAAIQQVKDIIRRTSENEGTWNWEMYPGIKYDKESGSIKYQKHIETLNTNHFDQRQETGNTSEAEVVECRIEPAGNENCQTVIKQVPDPDMDELNKKLNKAASELNQKNEKINLRNKKRNAAYKKTVDVAGVTPQGDYVNRRGVLRTHNTNNDVDEDAKNNIEAAFRSWYKNEKLEVFDESTLEKTGKPPYGKFDPVYYAFKNEDVKNKWTDAKKIDDIDIIERYKDNENIFYKQHYASVGKAKRLRGNREEENEAIKAYHLEETFTDADKETVRDLHFNIDTENQTDRLLNVPEIAQLWENAKGGDPYWADLGKKNYLDVNNKHDFAALFRLSEDEAHKAIAFKYSANTGYGITDLEDAINEAAGEKGQVEARQFGALAQNVLKDTIEEMKEAKRREQFLSTVSGFSGFGEVMDVNTSLTNSILGDSGVGGIVSWLGGGKAEESLETSLEKVTGVNRNSAVYNWQKWFDEQLVEKYGKDRTEYLPLDRQTKIIDAWKSKATDQANPYNAETGKFTDQFLNRINFESTEKLEEFLNAQSFGPRILTILKEKWSDNSRNRMQVTDQPYGSSMKNFQGTIDNKLQELRNQGLGNPDLSLELEGEEDPVLIDAQYARNFVNEYLQERFDQSKSMDEFVEYLDIRQEEQNPFQTQSLLDAIKMTASMHARTFMDEIQTNTEVKFDSDYYFDPNSYEGSREDLTEDFAEQKKVIEEDWAAAKAGDSYWNSQAYRFGTIPFNDNTISEKERKDAFARVHYAVKGKVYRNADGELKPFDGAEDVMNYTKVKNYIYEEVLPKLKDEALEQGSVFGQFITPEEFADDILEGLDPTDKSEWDLVLKQYGLENFQGSFDELKDYIIESLRTGSAQRIREQIKFLNEKRKKPTQKVLGISYIQREEDYKDEQADADTELYKTFQNAGFQGTEDEFYNDFFPDLDRGEQKLLQKGGKDDPLKTFGLDLDDPFASLGSITQFLDDDSADEIDDDDRTPSQKESYFTYDLKDSDTEWTYKPKKKSDQVLGEYTGWFKGL